MILWQQSFDNNSRVEVVRLLAKRYDGKSNVKLGGFRSQLRASHVSNHVQRNSLSVDDYMNMILFALVLWYINQFWLLVPNAILYI